jgi:hypothetical protein
MSESIVHFKIPDNQCQNLNGKTRLVRERKCSGNINFNKNKLVESSDHEASLSDAASTEV